MVYQKDETPVELSYSPPYNLALLHVLAIMYKNQWMSRKCTLKS